MRYPSPDPVRARVYREAGYWRDDTIEHLFRAAASRAPSAIAVRDASGASVSYATLADAADRLAGWLSEQQVGRGDVVTVCLPNWWQAIASFIAILSRGAVINPVPTTYGRADLEFVLETCRSRVLVVPGRFRSVDFTEVASASRYVADHRVPVLRIGDGAVAIGTPFETALTAPPAEPLAHGSADDPAAVLFTSGTESKPKGAVHTHNTVLFGERALSSSLRIGAADTAFMASPISHATGFLHGFAMTLTMGGTLSLLDVFSGPAAVAQMRAHRCAWTMGATPFLADVTATLEQDGGRLPDLRYFLCGGAPIPESLVRRATAVGLRVLSIYGSTESPPHTVVHPEDPIENAWTTDGRPLAGIEAGIVSPERRPLAQPGAIGEARSRGPNTFIGYFGEPELTRRYLDEEGWYYSGDLARIAEDGSIRIVGRLKDIVIRGGQNISPREVEDLLSAHPAVQAVAIVGMPHERLGETACAVVVPRPGHSLTLAEAVAFLEDKGMAKFKLPERLEIWDRLPMTPSGKVQKFLIRKALIDPARHERPE